MAFPSVPELIDTLDTDSDDFERHARALADPTRLQVYRAVIDAGRPVGVADLAEMCDVHPNTIRLHVVRLKEAGLVIEELEVRHSRGRPGYRYRPAPRQAGAWPGPTSYEHLALMLAETVRTGVTPREAGRNAGRREPVDIHPSPVDALVAAIARDGFAPTIEPTGDDRVELVMTSCPFRKVAEVDSRTVCQLHTGLCEGFAQTIGGVEVDGIAYQRPGEAGCRIRVRIVDDEPSAVA